MHRSLVERVCRALWLWARLAGRKTGYLPETEDYRFSPKFAWEIAWVTLWKNCPCDRCYERRLSCLKRPSRKRSSRR